MNVNLINDIINDFSNLYDELYKKRYSSLNEILDKSKQDLNILKEKISSNKLEEPHNKDVLFFEKTKNLISCIKILLLCKLNKYIIDFLNVLKKCIQYKLWSKLNSHTTIEIMKEISLNDKTNMECLDKIVEVIHTIIFTSFFELNEKDAINIYLINIKAFNGTNNYNNYNFKNPITLLFIALTDIIYKSNNDELIINITKFLLSLYIKDNINNGDNTNLELIKDIKNSVYTKCLSLELLSQGLKIIKEKNINNNYLEEFINNKILLNIKNSLTEIKTKQINTAQEYIHLLKLLRISMIIINNYNIEYDIISLIISFFEKETKIYWQKYLSIECLEDILNSNSLIINIYNYNKKIISKIFITLGLVYEENKNVMYNEINNVSKYKKLNKKLIEKNIIFFQGEENSLIKESELYNNMIDKIKECIQNSINLFSSMINIYKLSLNQINKELSNEQEKIKEIISFSSDIFKKIVLDLIDKEYKDINSEESKIQKIISYIQNLLILYSCLNKLNERDEFLKKLCNLSLEFNNKKNLVICSSIVSLSKFTQLFDKNNFILIFQTLEKIYIKYNNENDKNFDLIVENISKSYKKFYSEDDLKINDVEYKNETKEKGNLLVSTINNMFIDSKSINIPCLKNIFQALLECIKIEIEDNNYEGFLKNKDEVIIFYLTKLLTLAILNIENIFYFYDDYIIPIINLLKQKKILLNFTINLISSIIKEILFNHEKIVAKLKSEKHNSWLLNAKWQKKLFEALVSFVTDHIFIQLIKNRLLICIKTIVQQSGNYIDLFGWESILKICQILVNDNIEEIFLIIKLILNDYNAYLSIFNVMPIITLLGIFISYQKDKNICFNSIELFWSCANIVENCQKRKNNINDSQKITFEELLKEEKIDNFDLFYSGLYYKIFSQLLRINSDFRYDIRKNGINIFTEIFVSKMNSLDYENYIRIISDIFYNIFLINSKKYIEKERSISKKDENDINHKNLSPKRENELEQVLHASLLSMIKILKSVPNYTIEIKTNINSLDNIFESFLKQLNEIILFGTISLNSDIFHGLSEIKNTKSNNKLLFPSKVGTFMEMMNKFKEYIKSTRFKLTPYNKMQCIKMVNNLINILNDIFTNKVYYEFFTMQNEEIFNKIFDVIEFIFLLNSNIEQKTLEYSPQKMTEIEENIFNFIQNIPIVNEKFLFYYIFKFVNYDLKDNHSAAKCKRVIDCLIYIVNKNNGDCFILKEKNYNFLFQIIDKYQGLFDKMKYLDLKKYSNDNTFSKKSGEIMFNDLIIQISKFFFLLINKIENNYIDIILKIVEFYEYISNQIINEMKKVEDISNNNEIKNIFTKFFQSLINSLFIELSPLIYACLNEREDILKNIDNKLIKIIYTGCFKINKNTKNDIDKIINEPINNISITILISICKYKSNQEILDIIKKSNLKQINEKEFFLKYMNHKKKCFSLLISKLNQNLNIFKKEYEIKKEEILFLLKEIKNLEVFPELIEKNENRKIHFFYLYKNIIELLPIENNEIQILIKEIILKVLDMIKSNFPDLPEFHLDEE